MAHFQLDQFYLCCRVILLSYENITSVLFNCTLWEDLPTKRRMLFLKAICCWFVQGNKNWFDIAVEAVEILQSAILCEISWLILQNSSCIMRFIQTSCIFHQNEKLKLLHLYSKKHNNIYCGKNKKNVSSIRVLYRKNPW